MVTPDAVNTSAIAVAAITAVIGVTPHIVATIADHWNGGGSNSADAKRETDLINEQARYWQTYIAAFNEDPEVRNRARLAMTSLANRLERVAEASDPQAAIDLLAASEPITTSRWRFPLLLYGPTRDTLAFYAYGAIIAVFVFTLAEQAHQVINTPTHWIWLANAIGISYLVARGTAAMYEFHKLRRILRNHQAK